MDRIYFYLKLFFAFSIMMVSGACIIFSKLIFLKVIASIFLGCMFAHLIELQHELLHGLGIHHQKFNKIIGFLIGVPMLVVYADYRYHHMNHHRLLGTPENKEFFDYSNDKNSLWSFFSMLFMVGHYKALFIKIKNAFKPSHSQCMPDLIARNIRRQYQLLTFIIVAAIGVSFYFHTAILIYVWLIPLLFVATPVHALIELPEHFGCQTNDVNVYMNTRTIRSGRIMNWFTNGNNFHVEHHMEPRMPIHQLSTLHGRIKKNIVHLHSSYWQFYKSFFKDLSRQFIIKIKYHLAPKH